MRRVQKTGKTEQYKGWRELRKLQTDEPQDLRRILLVFEVDEMIRTQELVQSTAILSDPQGSDPDPSRYNR